MNTKEELDQLLRNTKPIDIDQYFKGLFVADLHGGVRDNADDFQKNEYLFVREILGYKQRGFQIFGLGDIVDLWENSDLIKIMDAYPWLWDVCFFDDRVSGNHDGDLKYPEALLFRYRETGKKILCVHGHQGDFFNDDGYPLGKFFVRYIWRNLQLIGFHDPTTATPKNPKKHEAVKKEIREWSREREQTIIFGHTHLGEFYPPYYFNCGAWTGDGGSGIEIVGEEIKLRIFE